MKRLTSLDLQLPVRNMKKKNFTFLSKPITIMSIFLVISLIGIIGPCLFKDLADKQPLPYYQLLALKILSFITYVVIAYFTNKRSKVARDLMAAIILMTGMHAAFLGIIGIEWHQHFLKPYFTVLGLYFIFGGIALFRLKKNEFLTI